MATMMSTFPVCEVIAEH